MPRPLQIDRYGLFLAIVFGGLGCFSAALLGIGVWLFRRNRRLPRLVKPRRQR
jgi:hypothetical protein